MDNHILNILLVDDSEVDVTITLRAFKKAKIEHQINLVHSGEECLNYVFNRGVFSDAKKHPRPDIILLDINMPKMNGFDVLKALKNKPSSAEIPVVMFTNSKNNQDITKSYQCGASSYIAKPATCSELVEALDCFDRYWSRVGRLPQHFDDYIYTYTNSYISQGVKKDENP